MHHHAYPFLAAEHIRDLAREAAASRTAAPAVQTSAPATGHGIGGIGVPVQGLRRLLGRLAAA